MEAKLKPPAECSAKEIEKFEDLVLKGGEVAPEGLSGRIRSAAQLAFLYGAEDELIAIGALKRPSFGYRNSIFERAQSSLNPDAFRFELGWLFVEEWHRGRRLSGVLVERLLSSAGDASVYATTREQNVAMQCILKSFDFAKSSTPYMSAKGDYKLVLYTRSK
jgi:hypothetical protein